MGKPVDFLVKNDVNFRKTRLPALYADFGSLKNLNPDGYEANIFAWNQALARLASEGLLSREGSKPCVFILDVDESLRSTLNHDNYGMPQSLGLVIRECVARQALIPARTFEIVKRNVYNQPSWGSLPWNIITWTSHQVGLTDLFFGTDRIFRDKYVIMKNMEVASIEVGKRIDKDTTRTSRYDRVMTRRQFERAFAHSLFNDQPLSTEDLSMLLLFLSRDKDIIDYDGYTVRLQGEGEERTITKEDTTIRWTKQMMEDLNNQVYILHRRIEDLDKEARAAVLSQKRIRALACLKSKKITEASLTRRYDCLHQLEQMTSKLQQASDQIEFVKIMEIGSDALKKLNDQVGGVDKVDDVLERLQQQMQATDQVAAILAESPGAVVDEAELDEELEALERAQKDKGEEEEEKRDLAEARKQLDNLPAVPTDPISERAKAQSPTAVTGIERLALGD